MQETRSPKFTSQKNSCEHSFVSIGLQGSQQRHLWRVFENLRRNTLRTQQKYRSRYSFAQHGSVAYISVSISILYLVRNLSDRQYIFSFLVFTLTNCIFLRAMIILIVGNSVNFLCSWYFPVNDGKHNFLYISIVTDQFIVCKSCQKWPEKYYI